MKIKEIPFVGYPVSDIDRSRKFYEEVLGLTLSFCIEVHPEKNEYWAEYNIADGCLAISNMWPPSGAPGGPTMALEVDDLDNALGELKQAGS